jgi:hypothetical protein
MDLTTTHPEARFGATTTQTHIPDHFIPRFQSMLELARTHEVERFIISWIKSEGGNAKWNPLNSSLELSGTVDWTEDHDYNSIPVRNYKYAMAGVCANALTLGQRNSDGSYVYSTLLKNLKDPTLSAEEIVNQSKVDIKRWGTSPTVMLDVLKTTP